MKLVSKLNLGTEKYPALTGIRAVGATVVFFDHFPLPANFHTRINVLAFFFVLSGFLITKIYYNKIDLSSKGWRTYFVNRFARIYPVYFLLLTTAILLSHNFSPVVLATNYTLTHALINNTKNFVIGPSWSLTVEECFYFLAPFIISIIKKFGFRISLLFGAILLIFALLISKANSPILHTPVFVFSTTFFGHFVEFYVGIYLALVMIKAETARQPKPGNNKYTVMGTMGVILIIILMAIVYSIQPLNTWLVILLNNFLIPIPIAVLYYGLLRENSLLSRILSGRFIGLLGRSSYSFYLLHTIIISQIAIPFLLKPFGSHYFICSLTTYLVAYGISTLIFLFYEEPLNILIRRKLIKRKSHPLSVARVS